MKTLITLFIPVLLIAPVFLFGALVRYPFTSEPIDVVIPCAEKDLRTLERCIKGIYTNCSEIRRIIVISNKRLSKNAEWCKESIFPFSRTDIVKALAKKDAKTQAQLMRPESRVGWYYQQLLKLYAPFVIRNISSNVLVLDADTIFLNPVKFLNKKNGGLYNPGSEYHLPYFTHAKKLIPGFSKVFPKKSGISHHMLLQRPVLDDLFDYVEGTHGEPLWKAFCRCVAPASIFQSGASEYEIYFNYVFARTHQVQIRCLKWKNIRKMSAIEQFASEGYHYVSIHSYNFVKE